MTSHSPASSPELPKPAIKGSDWNLDDDAFTADQMNAHYLKGYEAGSAADAQAAKQVPEGFVLVPRELVEFLNGAAHERAAGAIDKAIYALDRAHDRAVESEDRVLYGAAGMLLQLLFKSGAALAAPPASPQAPAPQAVVGEAGEVHDFASQPGPVESLNALIADQQSRAPSASPHQGADALPPFSELARLTQWLDAKFARHGEQEDADASNLLHTLWRAALTPQGADALREASKHDPFRPAFEQMMNVKFAGEYCLSHACDGAGNSFRYLYPDVARAWEFFTAGRAACPTAPQEVSSLLVALREIAWSNDSKWQADRARAALAHHQAPQQGEGA